MATFAYIAFDSKGKLSRGDIEEKSWTQALRRVKEMGLFPTSVKEKSRRAFSQKTNIPLSRPHAVAAHSEGSSTWFPTGISNKALCAFTRQIATLIDAGIPILRGLRSIEQQEENRGLRNLIRDIVAEIEGGSTFSEALSRHPRVFNTLYLSMVRAGETAGMLENALGRLAEFMERTQKVRGKIVSAMFYPAAVATVAVGILMLLMVFVIPKFKEVFSDVTGRTNLPPFTEFVLGSSDFVKNHLLFFLGVPLLFGGLVEVLCLDKARAHNPGSTEAQVARSGANRPQSRHCPIHPHARNNAGERGASPGRPAHCQRYRGQRRLCPRNSGDP